MKPFPAADILVLAAFAVAVLFTVAGALIAVLSTRLIRSVCGLALTCLGLALLYYFLHSPFLALMEILIYVGAICVTIIFAVMLAEPDEAPSRESRGGAFLWAGLALGVSGAVLWALVQLGWGHAWTAPVSRANAGTVQDLGVALLTTYSLAFEVISLVLLAAILGALVIAHHGRSKT
jgi:NADH-quinone oxidoreductase subunit J